MVVHIFKPVKGPIHFWIYVANATAMSAMAGAENLEQEIGLVNVEIVQWALGMFVAGTNAALAYFHQRQPKPPMP